MHTVGGNLLSCTQEHIHNHGPNLMDCEAKATLSPTSRLQLRREHRITLSTTRLRDLCPRLPDRDYPQLLHLRAKRLLNDPGEKLILARRLLVH